MADDMEVYPLVLKAGGWWLPYGLQADAETLAALFRSDCTVVFVWPEGGSWQFHVDEEGQEVVRINYGSWQPMVEIDLEDWQKEVLALVLDAIEKM
jgi:hypothetical protein